MADTFIQLPADGAGKKINAFTGSDGDYNQAVVIVDSTGTERMSAASPGFVQLNAGSASIGTVILGAGAAAIGSVVVSSITAALPAGTNILGKLNPIAGATATLANVAASASVVTLQALNAARFGLVIYNDSTSSMYVKLGSAASLTSFTYKLVGGATLELPTTVYTGIVTGIWDTATGNARVTELAV